VIKKSDEQRRREAAREGDRRSRAELVEASKAERRQVTVRKDDEVVVADQGQFAKPPAPPPFALTGRQRRELLERRASRITFPKDEPCPITVGEVYEITSMLSFVVTGISDTKTEFELHYDLLDERAHNLGKVVGYSSSSQGSIATRKAPEEQPLGGPQFRDETEGEALSPAEHDRIASESREDRIKRLQAHRTLLERQHRAMEEEGLSADIKWGLRRAISALTDRIDGEKRMTANAA